MGTRETKTGGRSRRLGNEDVGDEGERGQRGRSVSDLGNLPCGAATFRATTQGEQGCIPACTCSVSVLAGQRVKMSTEQLDVRSADRGPLRQRRAQGRRGGACALREGSAPNRRDPRHSREGEDPRGEDPRGRTRGGARSGTAHGRRHLAFFRDEV